MAGSNKYEEWFFQSDYDLETAIFMFDSQRYIYAIFMCHLSLEKALKGLFIKRMEKAPLKTHDLEYFIGLLNLEMNESDLEFVSFINKLSIPTRYPENLRSMFKVYNQENTKNILEQAKNVQSWIKQQ